MLGIRSGQSRSVFFAGRARKLEASNRRKFPGGLEGARGVAMNFWLPRSLSRHGPKQPQATIAAILDLTHQGGNLQELMFREFAPGRARGDRDIA